MCDCHYWHTVAGEEAVGRWYAGMVTAAKAGEDRIVEEGNLGNQVLVVEEKIGLASL